MSKFTAILSHTRKTKNMTKSDVAKKWAGLAVIPARVRVPKDSPMFFTIHLTMRNKCCTAGMFTRYVAPIRHVLTPSMKKALGELYFSQGFSLSYTLDNIIII